MVTHRERDIMSLLTRMVMEKLANKGDRMSTATNSRTLDSDKYYGRTSGTGLGKSKFGRPGPGGASTRGMEVNMSRTPKQMTLAQRIRQRSGGNKALEARWAEQYRARQARRAAAKARRMQTDVYRQDTPTVIQAGRGRDGRRKAVVTSRAMEGPERIRRTTGAPTKRQLKDPEYFRKLKQDY